MPVSGSDIGERPSEKIPSIDLAAGYPALKEEIEAAVASVLASGRYVGGPEVEGLEREFASYCGARDAVAVGSGTDSLRFTLIALGIGSGARGDGAQRNEVVTSPFSFAATTEAISQAGGRPVFSDIDPETFNLDPAGLEEALTPRTRAILPVHLYGHPADMPPILDLAARRDLAVVEDACQAHGAFHQESRTGSIGDAGCFSFYPTKNLGACGEGGMVTTSRPQVPPHRGGVQRAARCSAGGDPAPEAAAPGRLERAAARGRRSLSGCAAGRRGHAACRAVVGPARLPPVHRPGGETRCRARCPGA
jgi:hypothetical protein